MPHYRNGSPAKVGDLVTVLFEVTAVHEGETTCNVSLTAADDIPNEYKGMLTTNTKFAVPVSESSLSAANDVMHGSGREVDAQIAAGDVIERCVRSGGG